MALDLFTVRSIKSCNLLEMNKVPIVFAFDNNMVMPACVCISSLLMNAKQDTVYDIFVLYPITQELPRDGFELLDKSFPDSCFTFIGVEDDLFSGAFEIRGINALTYYRLLIPELIPQYAKVLYSDVDVIFRCDLSDVYYNTNMEGCYIAGVNSLSHLHKDRAPYYRDRIGIDPAKVVYAGNLIINSELMRADGVVKKMLSMIKDKYQFQDLDILNIVCSGKIKYLPPFFCLTTDISEYASMDREKILGMWSEDEISHAMHSGIVHYNGKKPWKGVCINFDIWWEYYRMSLFFNERDYFRFFKNRLEELDGLSLWKRIKVLLRYFVYGRRTY